MDIYRRAEEPSNFYIQVRSQEKSSDNPMFYYMPVKNEDIEIFELPVYLRGKNDPTCTVCQTDFNKVCKNLIKNKCTYTEFIAYEKGIVIKGYTSDGKIATIKEYGKCRFGAETKSSNTKSIINNTNKPDIIAPKLSIRNVDEIERFKLHIKTIKSLAKLNGFSNSSTIKFYIEKGAPMKLCTSIGSFGKLTVLVKTL